MESFNIRHTEVSRFVVVTCHASMLILTTLLISEQSFDFQPLSGNFVGLQIATVFVC